MEAKITRTEVVVVDTVSKNKYGDLLFTDKGSGEHKIGNKRVQYFEKVIIPDRTVQLNFANAYNKEYIYNANLVELPPEEEPTPELIEAPIRATTGKSQHIRFTPSKPVSTPAESPKIDKKPPGQQVGMTTKEIGDMIRAGKMKILFGVEAATELTKWYRGQILSTTRVTFDGANLPKFTAENT